MKIVTVFIVTIILFLLVREVDVIREKIPIDNFISLFSESEIQDLPLLKTTEELEKEKFPEELFSITEKEMSELIESLSLQEKLDMYCDVDNVIEFYNYEFDRLKNEISVPEEILTKLLDNFFLFRKVKRDVIEKESHGERV